MNILKKYLVISLAFVSVNSFAQIKLEAEDGSTTGANPVATNHAGFSGSGFLGGNGAGKVTWFLNSSQFSELNHQYSLQMQTTCNTTHAPCDSFVVALDNVEKGSLKSAVNDSWSNYTISSAISFVAKAGQTLSFEKFENHYPGNLDFVQLTVTNTPPTKPTLGQDGALASTDVDSDALAYQITAGEDNFEIVDGNLVAKSGVGAGDYDVTVNAYHLIGTDTLKSADTTFSYTVSASSLQFGLVNHTEKIVVYDIQGNAVTSFSANGQKDWSIPSEYRNTMKAGVYFLKANGSNLKAVVIQ